MALVLEAGAPDQVPVLEDLPLLLWRDGIPDSMRIAVDLDGCVYEWSKTARYLLRAHKGYPKDGPLGIESQSWNYISENVSKEDWDWLWNEGVEYGLFRYGHLVSGSVDALGELVADGHELVVATHRPQTAVVDTLDWLAFLKLPFSEVHILSGTPKSSVQADVLIDDKPENIVEWVDAGRTAILFDRPWNRERSPVKIVVPRLRVARGWPHVVEIVRNLRNLKAGAA